MPKDKSINSENKTTIYCVSPKAYIIIIIRTKKKNIPNHEIIKAEKLLSNHNNSDKRNVFRGWFSPPFVSLSIAVCLDVFFSVAFKI